MPTPTFFNLSSEKKQRIIDAAGIEFSSHPLYESSINNIIKTAKIPRGSFYQYFEDLPDLYGYYFSLIIEDLQRTLVSEVIEANGDFFVGVKNYARAHMGNILFGKHRDFYKNFFIGANVAVKSKNGDHPRFDIYHSDHLNELKHELHDAINWNQLKVDDQKSQDMIQRLITMIFFHSFANYFVDPEEQTLEKLQANLEKNLDWVAYGVKKQEDL